MVLGNDFKRVVDELAKKLVNHSSLSSRLYKHAIHKLANMDLDTLLTYASHLQYLVTVAEDFNEDIARPSWKKRKPVLKVKRGKIDLFF